MSGPQPPAEYGGDYQTDEALQEDGYATGLDVWSCVEDAYSDFLGGDSELANVQLWSLREAVRAEYHAEILAARNAEKTAAMQGFISHVEREFPGTVR